MSHGDNEAVFDAISSERPGKMQSIDKNRQDVIDLIIKEESIPFVLVDESDPSAEQICTALTNLAQRARDEPVTLSTFELDAIQRVELILRGVIELMDEGGNATLSEITEQIGFLASNKEAIVGPEVDQILVDVPARDLVIGEMVDLKSCPFLKDHDYADDVYGQVKQVTLETLDGKDVVTIQYDDFGVVHYPIGQKLLVLSKV